MICELIHKPYNKRSLSSNFTIHCRLSRTGRSPATLRTLQLTYRAAPLAAGWQCTLQASFARSGPNLCRWHKRLRADTMEALLGQEKNTGRYAWALEAFLVDLWINRFKNLI